MSISLAALAAIGSLASTGVGALRSAQENNESLEELKAQMRYDDEEYRRLLARPEVENPENAGLLRRLQELQRERYGQARSTNVVAGGTDAHLAAMQQQGNDIVVRTGQGIAERATGVKDALRKERNTVKRENAKTMFGIRQQKAQGIATAAGQASKAMAGIAGAAGGADNPFDMFGMSQDDYVKMAQSNIDAATDAAVKKQLEDSLRDTLENLDVVK